MLVTVMRPWALLSLVLLMLPGTAQAGEAQVDQVIAPAKAGCALCGFVLTDSAHAGTPDIVATPGPPNTHDIIQMGDRNTAIGFVFGDNNYLGQFQFGSNDTSVVGLIAEDASVSVIQDGSNLQSNLLVWGNPGGPVTVYQPHGSAPVNAAIYTAADGTQVILPGNATTIIRQ